MRILWTDDMLERVMTHMMAQATTSNGDDLQKSKLMVAQRWWISQSY